MSIPSPLPPPPICKLGSSNYRNYGKSMEHVETLIGKEVFKCSLRWLKQRADCVLFVFLYLVRVDDYILC